jgi:hypothetical protein
LAIGLGGLVPARWTGGQVFSTGARVSSEKPAYAARACFLAANNPNAMLYIVGKAFAKP